MATDRLEALIDSPIEPFKSTHAKNLFGLVAASNHLRGELKAERDFAQTGAPVRASGNQRDTARAWFQHRRRSSQGMGNEAAATASQARWSVTTDGDDALVRSRASAARDRAAAQGEQSRLVREIEQRERLLRAAREEMRTARALARAIQRSGSWRVVEALSRVGAVLRRRHGEGTPQRLERLAWLEPPATVDGSGLEGRAETGGHLARKALLAPAGAPGAFRSTPGSRATLLA